MTAVVEESNSTLSCTLSRYILAKDIDAVRRILHERKENTVPLTADNRGWTALHFAASADEYADYLELLLCNKDVLILDLNARTHQGETAMYIACKRGCKKNCAILLKSQCNPELSTWHRSTPLHIASKNGHIVIVSQLISRGVNLYRKDCDDFTPHCWASIKRHLEVKKLLSISMQMKMKVSDALAPDINSNSLLHSACRLGNLEVLKILLKADYSRVDSLNQDGMTPLMLAVQNCHNKCVKYLLNHDANANNCSNDHMSSLEYAARSGNKQVLELVLQATSLTFIRDHMLRIPDVIIGSGSEVSNSLMSHVIQSGSPECMLVLLQSGLPKCILEAPYLEKYFGRIHVFSPLAFLFKKFILDTLDSCIFDEFLKILLQHGITHLNEFSQSIEWKLYLHSSDFRDPFDYILDSQSSFEKLYHYSNMLIENGITPDYFLQYSLQCSLQPAVGDCKWVNFQNFGSCHFQYFYDPVIKAMRADSKELVELFMSNSAILEPSHLWNFLNSCVLSPEAISDSYLFMSSCRRLPWFHLHYADFKSNPKVINYLANFNVGYRYSSQLSMYSLKEAPTLQELCRYAIRKSLRDLTLRDNINNFKGKINSLPLPKSLKNYLLFKT